mmetsp:Transcript_67975/g.162262  ORF Transcript_67975/g.162262 Transcript_67975/m.162262 type:complete len:96 (-) Transcript_67975:433-720(-)
MKRWAALSIAAPKLRIGSRLKKELHHLLPLAGAYKVGGERKLQWELAAPLQCPTTLVGFSHVLQEEPRRSTVALANCFMQSVIARTRVSTLQCYT